MLDEGGTERPMRQTTKTAGSTESKADNGRSANFWTYFGGAATLIAILGFFGINQFYDIVRILSSGTAFPDVSGNAPAADRSEIEHATELPEHAEIELADTIEQPPNPVEQRERIFGVQAGSSFFHGASGSAFSVEFFKPTTDFRFAKLTISSPRQDSLTETFTGIGDSVEFEAEGIRYRAAVLGLDFTREAITIDVSALPRD